MNLFERFLIFLQGEMPAPSSYGWFHLTWLFLSIIITINIIKRKEKNHEKSLKYVLGIYAIPAFILELLKQLIWSYSYDPALKVGTWDYTWYAAPFQLCTTPIIVCLICLFLKKNKLRDYLLSYMAFFTILGSIATALYPESCFVRDILVDIHTMYLHFGALVVSFYLLRKEVDINIKSFFKGFIVFIIFVFIALSLDIIIYNSGILNGETFNMFYISPYFNSGLPIYNQIQPKVPYLIYLLIYISSLTLGAYIIYLLTKLSKKIFKW